MKNRLASIVVLILFFSSFLIAQTKSDKELQKRIERIENEICEIKIGEKGIEKTGIHFTLSERMKNYNVPGVSIAIIDDLKIEWTKAYGLLNAEKNPKVDTESIFQAASTSKFITAVIVMKFIEEGMLSLDIDINKYLKSWQIPENEFTKDKKVTIRNLLTHQSGLPTTNFGYDEKIGVPTIVQVLKGESPAKNKPAITGFIPGSKWQYSNIGYVVLQLLLEDLTGKHFNQIAMETVFDKVGMTTSTFIYPLDGKLKDNEAMPHDEKGKVGEPSLPPTALAQGGLLTTPKDLALFTNELMLAYHGKSKKLLSQESFKKILTKETDLDPKMFGFPVGMGLGVMVRGEGKKITFSHPGSNLPGINCWLIGFPELKKGAVIMTNGAMGELLMLEILNTLEKEYNWPPM